VAIEVKNIVKRFGAFTALDDVELKVANGELLALLGPSGSGKTTLLRIIAGLETPDAGLVQFDRAEATRLSARDRNVGFVFQHYALFRHMTVFENVAFGLRVRPRRLRPSGRAATNAWSRTPTAPSRTARPPRRRSCTRKRCGCSPTAWPP